MGLRYPRIAALIARLPLIIAAYVAASVAAGFMLSLGMVLNDLQKGHSLSTSLGPNPAALMVDAPLILGILVAIFSFAPAAVVVVLSEAFGWRWATLHGVAGVFAAIWPLMMGPGPMPWRLLLALSLAGLVGGLVYWWIAGRNAGNWRTPAHRASS
jgi:hypothetical protein